MRAAAAARLAVLPLLLAFDAAAREAPAARQDPPRSADVEHRGVQERAAKLKSHYDALCVATTADELTIKQAFRREIARYHPDKVQHLGPEFQAIASQRAAELTAAYKTLSNAALRAAYDAALAAAPDLPGPEPGADAPSPAFDRFRQERADRDDILRRVVLARVRDCFADPEYHHTAYEGFDLAFVPRGRGPVFRRAGKPSLLVRMADKIDGALVLQSWTDALRARVAEKPVVLVLLARDVDRQSVASVIEDRRKKHPKVAESIHPVVIDTRDWSADIPSHSPDCVRATVERIRNFTS